MICLPEAEAMSQPERPETRAKRLSAIRGLQLSSQDVTKRTVSNLIRLCEQLELCSDERGSHARQTTLAGRLWASERTYRRWFAVAVDEGLVEVFDAWTTEGRRRLTRLNWKRIMDGPEVETTPRETQLFLGFDDGQEGQNGRMQPDKMAGCSNKDIKSLGNTSPSSKPPAPEPAAATDGSAHAGQLGGGWEEVRGLLLARGMQAAAILVSQLRERGLEAWAAMAVIRFWDAHAGAWGVGALWHRLRDLQPGDVPETAWRTRWAEVIACWAHPRRMPKNPRENSGAVRSVAPRPSSESFVDVRAERDKRAFIAAERLALLERDYGPGWDSLSPVEQSALVARLGSSMLQSRWATRPPRDSLRWRNLRAEVLELLAEREPKLSEVRG